MTDYGNYEYAEDGLNGPIAIAAQAMTAAQVARASANTRPRWPAAQVMREITTVKRMILGQLPMHPDVRGILDGLVRAGAIGVLKGDQVAVYFKNMALMAPTHDMSIYFGVLAANADV